jgi:N-6 DNA Methylase
MPWNAESTRLTYHNLAFAREAALTLSREQSRRGADGAATPVLALADRCLKIHGAAAHDFSRLTHEMDPRIASVLQTASASPRRADYAIAVLHFVERMIGLSHACQSVSAAHSSADGAGFELERRRSRNCGTYGTPNAIADVLVEDVLMSAAKSCNKPIDVLDLSLEGGHFPLTVAAGRPAHLRTRCYGIDRDPVALRLARRLLQFAAAGCSPAHFDFHLSCRDSLLDRMPRGWPSRFTAVIGNPPWLARSWTASRRIRTRFAPWLRGRFDLYLAFMLRAHELVAPGGFMGLVVPCGFLFNMNGEGVRRLLLDEYDLLTLRIYPQRSFVEVPCVIPVSFVARKRLAASGSTSHTAIIYDPRPSGGVDRPREHRRIRATPHWKKIEGCVFNPGFRQDALFLLDRLADTVLADFGTLGTGGRLSRTRPVRAPFAFRGVHGRAIRAFHVCPRRLIDYRRGELRFDRLPSREFLHARKVVFQDFRYMTHAERIVAALAGPGDYPVSTAAMFVPKEQELADFFEALLNSAFANAWYKMRDISRSIKLSYLRQLPVVYDREAWASIASLAKRCRTIRAYYHRRLSLCTLWNEERTLADRFPTQQARFVRLHREINDRMARLYKLSQEQAVAVDALSAARVF